MDPMDKTVTIYTDGACKGNPGQGGWGALLCYNGHEKAIYGGEANTTNNRMELMAAIQALKVLKKPCQVAIYTDSQYLRQGIMTWLDQWIARGWKTASKRAVKNQDLWKQLAQLRQEHQIQWHWVKGHSGDYGNDRADALANQGVGCGVLFKEAVNGQ